MNGRATCVTHADSCCLGTDSYSGRQIFLRLLMCMRDGGGKLNGASKLEHLSNWWTPIDQSFFRLAL